MNRFSARISREFFQRYYSSSVSYPYLSGDLFAREADARLDENTISDNAYIESKVLNSVVLFCKGDLARLFLNEYASRITPKIIIFGNSDENFDEIDFPVPNSVKKLFIQNWTGIDSRVSVLPIGIENLRLGNNGRLSLFTSGASKNPPKNEILIGPFAATHSERILLENTADRDGPWKSLKGRVSPRDYRNLVDRYKFVACPRGNGIDTHRFWETLYRDRIPVITKSGWSRNIASLDIPFIEISSWEAGSLEEATKRFSHSNFSANKVPSLWWYFWESEFKKIIN